MKVGGIITASLAVVLAVSGTADARKGRPGWCEDQDDCNKNYDCISVQTTRSGTEEVKQCLPYKRDGDVCTGVHPGLCPSFSNWRGAYKSVSSVCAFIVPTVDCNYDGQADEGEVACLEVEDEKGDELGVIYGCVDYDGDRLLFEKNDLSDKAARYFNYSEVLLDSCVNPKNDDVLCSGRGTCAPRSPGQMEYKCLCNVGYEGTYCQKIVSNECATEGQCSAGVCDLDEQQCKCPEGTTGPQCSECDMSSEKACGRNGKCKEMEVDDSEDTPSPAPTPTDESSTDGSEEEDFEVEEFFRRLTVKNMCECKEGYAGEHCDRRIPRKNPGNKGGKEKDEKEENNSEEKKDNGSQSVVMSAFAVMSVVMLAVFN